MGSSGEKHSNAAGSCLLQASCQGAPTALPLRSPPTTHQPHPAEQGPNQQVQLLHHRASKPSSKPWLQFIGREPRVVQWRRHLFPPRIEAASRLLEWA